VPPKISLMKLTQGKTIKRMYEENHVIQDMLVPVEDLQRSLEFFDEQVDVYPIWICPFTLPCNPGMLKTKTEKEEM
jgi:delta24-sterol reductase